MCGVVWSYTGPPTGPRRSLRCSRSPRAAARLGRHDPAPGPAEHVRRALPAGLQWYWKADFVNELPDAAIDATSSTARCCRPGTRPCTSTRSTGRPPGSAPGDAAWDYRDANWASVIAGIDPDPADNPRRSELGARLLGGAAPLLGGRRLRQHDDGRGTRSASRASYRDNYDRLAADQGAVRPGQPLPRQPEHQASRQPPTPT